MKPVEKSIGAYFLEFAEQSGDRQFLYDENRSYTVQQAFHGAISVGNRLHSLGVREAATVALRCTRSLDTCIIYLALQMLGATTLLTDPHQTVGDFLEGAGVQADFCITNEASSQSLSANGGWQVTGKGSLSIPDCPVSEESRFPEAVNVHIPATVIFTSGSTGKSKGVMLSQYNLVNHIRNFSVSGCYLESDVSIDVLPLHHAFGLAVLLMGVIQHYTIFFPEELSIAYVANCIQQHRITRLDGVPSFACALAEYHRTVPFCADTLRVGVLGGAPSTKAQFDFMEAELGIMLLPVYGQSECIGITGADETKSAEVRATTVGAFLPMNRGMILDENGTEVPTGEEGEICVTGPAVMLGYLGDAESAAVDAAGRLHTGDLGFLDADGNLHISGRKKEIIIRNGNNLSARRIEEALLSLESVRAAAVVGIAHEQWGEVPCALAVPAAGTRVSEESLRQELSERLSKNEIPHRILLADAIPMTSSGKPDKQRIKGMFSY